MTTMEFKDGIKFVIDSDELRKFFIENGIPYKDYLEFIVRKKLGQNLNTYADYNLFKQNRKESDDKPDHLRFDMRGQRDDDGGLEENKQIFRLFDLPITVKNSYGYEEHDSRDFGNIFIFHKGTPILYQRLSTGELQEKKQYGGWTTVDLLVELIDQFSPKDFLQEELKVL
jgi:hypothetical protein